MSIYRNGVGGKFLLQMVLLATWTPPSLAWKILFSRTETERRNHDRQAPDYNRMYDSFNIFCGQRTDVRGQGSGIGV